MVVDEREFQEVKTILEQHLKSCAQAAQANEDAHHEIRRMISAVSNRLWLLLATTLVGTIAILGAVLAK